MLFQVLVIKLYTSTPSQEKTGDTGEGGGGGGGGRGSGGVTGAGVVDVVVRPEDELEEGQITTQQYAISRSIDLISSYLDEPRDEAIYLILEGFGSGDIKDGIIDIFSTILVPEIKVIKGRV